jgi:hypothetical protein
MAMYYREQDSLKWKNDFNKVLNSLILASRESSLRIDKLLNNKIDTLKNLEKFSVNDEFNNYTLDEFGSIKIPKELDQSKYFKIMPNLPSTVFFQDQMTPLTKSARILIGTMPNLTSRIDSNLEFFKKVHLQGKETMGIKILQCDSSTSAISINNQNALMFSYISQVEDYPPNTNFLYRFINFDRINLIELSYPVKDSAIWREKFEKVVNSIKLVSIYK